MSKVSQCCRFCPQTFDILLVLQHCAGKTIAMLDGYVSFYQPAMLALVRFDIRKNCCCLIGLQIDVRLRLNYVTLQ